MFVLGIESSCDETGIAIVKDGLEIISNEVMTQEDLHSRYGGVVPELACRRHVDVLQPLLKKALSIPLEDIDLIAVTMGPGLIGALLIGINFAQGLSLSLKKPLVGVNHVEAHLYAAWLESKPSLPAIGAIVSGGHTSLVYIEDVGRYTLIGQTWDDAAGEAFDKVARLLGLPYPGGQNLENLAIGGDPYSFSLKAGKIKQNTLDFSFSGLKTACLYAIKDLGENISELDKKNIAASFQHAALSDIVKKIHEATQVYNCESVIMGGGVCQNSYLKKLMKQKISIPIFWPPSGLCSDNGAMIAGLGYHVFKNCGEEKNVKADPRLKLNRL